MSVSGLLGIFALVLSALLLYLARTSPQGISERCRGPLAAGFTDSAIWNVVIDMTAAAVIAIVLMVTLRG